MKQNFVSNCYFFYDNSVQKTNTRWIVIIAYTSGDRTTGTK